MKKHKSYRDDESAGSLDNFICNDDDEDYDSDTNRYAKKFSSKNFRFKDSSDEYSDDSGGPMEAGYDSLQEEEEYSRAIGNREDREQQLLIEQEELEDERRR